MPVYIVNELRNLVPASDILKRTNVSTNFISIMLPYLSITATKLHRVLFINEFRGNSEDCKYRVLLIVGEKHKKIDLLKPNFENFKTIILLLN